MAALELRLAEVEQRLEAAEQRLAVAGQRLGRSRLFGRVAVLAAVAAVFALMPVGNTHAEPQQGGLPDLDDRLTAVEGMVLAIDSALEAVEAKTAPLSVDGDDFIITGKNVHIRDGSGLTDGDTGLGNLTIGYNELGNFRGDVRTGTHNLVLGSLNNYAGFGGLVAGTNNEISGDFASVTAGAANTASGPGASVTAGGANVASGLFSSVSGGENNTASGSFSSVSGGNARTSAGPHDWRAGGLFQTN
jgi:hypothetical protein